jgi:DNA-binding transcriptional MerR regulator
VSELPDKQYFKIGEVSRITGVKPHVLRFWETEFGIIRPQKTKSNQRLYKRHDVENLILVKRLLYAEGYTIVGARKKLRELQRAGDGARPESATRVLAQVRERIVEILEIVDDDDA